MNDSEPCWVTGWGAMSALGAGRASIHSALREGQPGFSHAEVRSGAAAGATFWIGALPPAAGEAVRAHESASTDRATALALYAAGEAWTQAGCGSPGSRGGVFWGTGMAGLDTIEASYRRLLVEQLALRPMTVPRIMGNAAAAQLAIKYGLRGPNQTYTVACASSAMALGEALLALRAGRVDVALAGGSEAMLVPGVLAAWRALNVLARADGEAPAGPFSARRAGLVIAEGAAALVIERASHARRRGARPLAVLSGYGSSCDAASLVHPDSLGQREAMAQAIADAGLAPDAIDAVHAHATATPAGDAQEGEALASVFGDGIPPLAATKSLSGHALGAAGALSAAFCVASLQEQVLPPTAGCDPLDPKLTHLPVSGSSRKLQMRHVLSNSFAFGGANVSLVFGRAPVDEA